MNINLANIKNVSKKISSILLALTLVLSVSGCGLLSNLTHTKPEVAIDENCAEFDNAEFTQYTDGLFNKILSESVVNVHTYLEHPEKYGLDSYDYTFGRYDLDNLSDDSEILDIISTLKTFDYSTLSKKQQLTYQTLMKSCELDLEYSDLYLLGTQLHTTTGIQLELPILLGEYSFLEKKDIDEYLKVLEDVDDFFVNLIAYEKKRAEKGYFMEDTLVEEIVEGCQSFLDTAGSDTGVLVSTFADRLSTLPEITVKEKEDYINRNKDVINNHVIPGYKALIEGLNSLKGTNAYKGGLCNYPDGKRYFEYLLKSDLGWSKTVEEYDKLLDNYLSANMLKIQALAALDSSIIDDIYSYTFKQTEPTKVIEDLKKKYVKDFPEIPEVNYSINYISKSLEDYASPAMYFIPQIDNMNRNSIYINNASGQTDESGLYTTLAHEGYPGHLYQMQYFAATNPDRIRYLTGPGGYTEGWGSYVEVMSYEYNDGASANANKIMSANYRATLCLYAKGDIGVNYFGWTERDLLAFIQKYGFNDAAIAKEMYNAFVSDPGNYCKYVLGMIGFEELKNQASLTLGDNFDLKSFHKYVLDIGPIQFDILFENLEPWMKNQQK